MATNSWKQNAGKQDTSSTSDEVRGQDTFGPNAIQVADALSGKTSKTPLVVDGTQAA